MSETPTERWFRETRAAIAAKHARKRHRFIVEIDGLEVAGFHKCDTLEIVTVEARDPDVEVREWMRGTFDTGPIIMRRAVLTPPSDEASAAREQALRDYVADAVLFMSAPEDDPRFVVVKERAGTTPRVSFAEFTIGMPHPDPEPPPLPPTGGGSGGETW